ncbi:hypothetical protein DXO122_13380 [Xanthomonas oryzae pv. oryzae]|nr:hypothetical protein DXO122_13380 [Xanthomonas oryzae pv. oryzae]
MPVGSTHYVADGFPDRIVATPAQDAATGFAVAWRTDASVNQPRLELVVAGNSPGVGTPRRIRASTATLASENGSSHHHRADVDGLHPDTLYAYRLPLTAYRLPRTAYRLPLTACRGRDRAPGVRGITSARLPQPVHR